MNQSIENIDDHLTLICFGGKRVKAEKQSQFLSVDDLVDQLKLQTNNGIAIIDKTISAAKEDDRFILWERFQDEQRDNTGGYYISQALCITLILKLNPAMVIPFVNLLTFFIKNVGIEVSNQQLQETKQNFDEQFLAIQNKNEAIIKDLKLQKCFKEKSSCYVCVDEEGHTRVFMTEIEHIPSSCTQCYSFQVSEGIGLKQLLIKRKLLCGGSNTFVNTGFSVNDTIEFIAKVIDENVGNSEQLQIFQNSQNQPRKGPIDRFVKNK